VRGERGQGIAGTGLGLALGRELAQELGGSLQLLGPPAAIGADLPATGNAFCLSLPPQTQPPTH
jgi:signal transduction histidine kinase